MQTPRATATESAIWGRLLSPGGSSLSGEAALAILKVDFPRADKDRMHKLAAKARAGTLTAQEKEEIDAYGRIWKLPFDHEVQGPRGTPHTRSAAHRPAGQRSWSFAS